MMSRAPSHRYLVGLAASVVVIFGLIWLYVIMMPAAFLESGYAIWVAKQGFISRCDLGEAVISGDSRAEAAIDPRGLDIATRNISLGAETPVEGYFFIRRAMNCKTPPRQILFTFAMPDFTRVSEFLWENGARFGFVGTDELQDISKTAATLSDPSVENVKSRLGFGGALRNLAYASRFPPLYFNALVMGQGFRRAGVNQAALVKAREGLGHVSYFRHGDAAPALAGPAAVSGDFHVLPVQNAFFERTLTLLQQKNVQAVFVPMPVSQTVARQMTGASNRQFEAYLLGLAKRYPNFHVVTPLMVAWPDEAFVDGIHMEASYVARFTERFRICQNAAQPQTGPVMSCDLSWASVSGSGVAHR